VARSDPKPLVSIVLAATENTGFNSLRPKVLHNVAHVPMVVRVVRAVRSACASRTLVTVKKHEGFAMLRDKFGDHVELVELESAAGPVDEIKQCEPEFDGFDGDLLVVRCDCPLLRAETVRRLLDEHSRVVLP